MFYSRFLLTICSVFLCAYTTSEQNLIPDNKAGNPFPKSLYLMAKFDRTEILLEKTGNRFQVFRPDSNGNFVTIAEIKDPLFIFGKKKYVFSLQTGTERYSYFLLTRKGCCAWQLYDGGSSTKLQRSADYSRLIRSLKTKYEDKVIKPSSDFSLRAVSGSERLRFRKAAMDRYRAEQRKKAEAERRRREALEAAKRAARLAAIARDKAPTKTDMARAMRNSSIGLTIHNVDKVRCRKEKAYTYICDYRVQANVNIDHPVSNFFSALTGLTINTGRFWKVGNSWYFKRI